MAAPQNHWKLGVFVITGLALALGTVAVLGARSMNPDVGIYLSYFDESVQGLDVGSPIKFRGVPIGTVGKIRVAPDHRHVEVESFLGVEELSRLGLDIAAEPQKSGALRKLAMADDLRLQLASAGLTGVKFLQLDFFDVAAYPAPVLPFPVPQNYIPTAPSLGKNIEDTLTSMTGRIEEIADQTASVLGELGLLIRETRKEEIPAKLATTIDRTNGLLLRIDRKDGLVSSFEHASAAIDDAVRDASGVGSELVQTLVSVQAAARSFKRFLDALEQDPDMLLKGRRTEMVE